MGNTQRKRAWSRTMTNELLALSFFRVSWMKPSLLMQKKWKSLNEGWLAVFIFLQVMPKVTESNFCFEVVKNDFYFSLLMEKKRGEERKRGENSFLADSSEFLFRFRLRLGSAASESREFRYRHFEHFSPKSLWGSKWIPFCSVPTSFHGWELGMRTMMHLTVFSFSPSSIFTAERGGNWLAKNCREGKKSRAAFLQLRWAMNVHLSIHVCYAKIGCLKI